MVLKIIVWFILIFAISGVSNWIHTAYLPPMTSDVAVKQVQNSDAAYQELRTHEMTKNWITTGTITLCVVVSIIVFLPEIKKIKKIIIKK